MKREELFIVFETAVGSQVYGFSTPESDTDIRGVAIPPMEYYFGIQHFDQLEQKEPDVVIFNIVKAVTLIADNNPNMLELLYIPERFWTVCHDYWKEFIAHRDWFLCRKVRFTFSGYAYSQLKRIKTHKKWIDGPPTKPERAAFGLPEAVKVMSMDQIQAARSLPKEALSGNLHQEVQAELDYARAMTEWQDYQRWLKERNPARQVLEAKCGYDCYSDDTEFLTEHGWKTFNDVQDGIRLATVNPATGAMEFQHYTERYSAAFSGQMFDVPTQYSNFRVTGNHRLLVSRIHRQKSNGFSQVYEAAKASWSLRSLADVVNSRATRNHIRLCAEPRHVDYPVSDDYLLLLGAYASEGCANWRKVKLGQSLHAVRITQKEGGRMCPVMDGLMQKRPGLIRRYVYPRVVDGRPLREVIWVISNKSWASALINDCGYGSCKMTLPTWTMQLSKRQARLLLSAILAGDGTRRPFSWILYTASKSLADSVQAMCVCCGIPSQVWGPYVSDTVYKRGLMIYQVCVRWDDKIVAVLKGSAGKRGSIKPVTVLNRRIVCFAVPNGVLITRRNGVTAIQGNSKHGVHLIRLMRQGVEILKTGDLLVDRRGIDADELKDIRFGKWSYDQLIASADALDAEMKELYEITKLRDKPDREAIEDLLVFTLKKHFGAA